MAFPTAPAVNDTYTTPGGTTYVFSADGAWRVSAGGGGGSTSSFTLNANGTIDHDDGNGNTVSVDLPAVVSQQISDAEAAVLVRKGHDGTTAASAAEIAALDGNETLLIELDNGQMREIAIQDLPSAGGISLPANSAIPTGEAGSATTHGPTGPTGDAFPFTVTQTGFVLVTVTDRDGSGALASAEAFVAVSPGDVIDWEFVNAGQFVRASLNGTIICQANGNNGSNTSTDQMVPHPGQTNLLEMTFNPPKIGAVTANSQSAGATFIAYKAV